MPLMRSRRAFERLANAGPKRVRASSASPPPPPGVVPAAGCSLLDVSRALVGALVLPGSPVPMPRARTFFDSRVRRVVSKTPRRALAEKARIRDAWSLAYPAQPPTALPLGIRVLCYFRRAHAGDWDNYAKLAQDALQGVAFTNDRQVCSAHAEVWDWDPCPRVEIVLFWVHRVPRVGGEMP